MGNYEYTYEIETITAGDIKAWIPGAFMIGGLTEDIATGILYGLRQTLTIRNPECHEITTHKEEFHGVPGAVRRSGAGARPAKTKTTKGR